MSAPVIAKRSPASSHVPSSITRATRLLRPSETTISGGIAEALIATACGLTIAVVCLIALNYFSAKVAKFTFQMQTACTNTEILINSAKTRTALDNETSFAITA